MTVFLYFYTELNFTSVEGKVHRGIGVNIDEVPMAKFLCTIMHFKTELAIGLFITMEYVITLASTLFFMPEKKSQMMMIDPKDLQVFYINTYGRFDNGITAYHVSQIHKYDHYNPGTNIHDLVVLNVSYCIESMTGSFNSTFIELDITQFSMFFSSKIS